MMKRAMRSHSLILAGVLAFGPGLALAAAQGAVSPQTQAGSQPSSSNSAPGAQGQPSGTPRPGANPSLPSDTPRQGTVQGADQPGRVQEGTREMAPTAPPQRGTPQVGDGKAGEAGGPGTGRSGSGGSGNAPGPAS